MTNLINSPQINHQHSLGSLDIMVSLSSRLAGHTDFASICIKNAIASQMPAEKILSTIKDMITDNRILMEAILGEQLLNKILAS